MGQAFVSKPQPGKVWMGLGTLGWGEPMVVGIEEEERVYRW